MHSKTLSLVVTADVSLADCLIDKDIFLQPSTILIIARKET